MRIIDKIANNEIAAFEICLDELEAVVVRFREQTLHDLFHIQYTILVQSRNNEYKSLVGSGSCRKNEGIER